VRALFSAPGHGGALDNALCAAVEDQGVRISLFATVEDGMVTALRFQAWGCPHVIAAAEAFCAEFEGQAVSGLLEFSASDLMQSLSVPVEKSGRILVLEDAVRSLGSVVRGASNN
jgi:NifU-like protein involved in Fe-S cluster formation